MSSEFELEVGLGPEPDQITAHVVHAASGVDATATSALEIDTLFTEPNELEDLLRASGEQLFNAVFTGPVLTAYRASVDAAAEHDDELRLVLQLTSPELDALPWEALYDPDAETFICRKESVIRRSPAPGEAPPEVPAEASAEPAEAPGPASEEVPAAPASTEQPTEPKRFSRRAGLIGALALLVVAVLVGVVAVNHNRGSSDPSSAPAPATPLVATDLLTVTPAVSNLGNACDDQKGWAFPQTTATLPYVDQIDDPNWVAQNGGVPVSGNYYAFTLTALTPSNVTVTDIQASVVSQAPPMQGVYPAPWSSGCSGVVPSTFRLNLDDSPVSVVATPGDGMSGPGEVIGLPHRLDYNQPEVWHLTPVTQNCQCSWVATIHWTVDDQSFSTAIDDNGKPFQVTATSNATMIDNDDGQLNHWQVTTLGG